jgi:hypothetical protein
MAAPEPLGHSLRLEQGDLVVAAGTLEAVRGIDSLAQALTLALETQLGSDAVNVVFGFDLRALGENPYGVRTRKEYLRLQLVRTIASDQRVKEIRELYFDDDPRFFELAPGVDEEEQRRRVRTSRRTTATIVVETRSAEQLTLQAGVPSA